MTQHDTSAYHAESVNTVPEPLINILWAQLTITSSIILFVAILFALCDSHRHLGIMLHACWWLFIKTSIITSDCVIRELNFKSCDLFAFCCSSSYLAFNLHFSHSTPDGIFLSGNFLSVYPTEWPPTEYAEEAAICEYPLKPSFICKNIKTICSKKVLANFLRERFRSYCSMLCCAVMGKEDFSSALNICFSSHWPRGLIKKVLRS